MFFTNKHVIAAFIIAPILAVIAYFATDYLVSERPHKAVDGSHYPLVAKSNCRYQSGRCTFKNGDLKVNLVAKKTENDNIELQLSSDISLQGVKIALATADNQNPTSMNSSDEMGKQWQTTVSNQDMSQAKLLIVLSAENAIYYGETETTFTTYQTSFSQANMQ